MGIRFMCTSINPCNQLLIDRDMNMLWLVTYPSTLSTFGTSSTMFIPLMISDSSIISSMNCTDKMRERERERERERVSEGERNTRVHVGTL